MPDQPPGDRAVILACSVRSLRRYWLEVRCGCGRSGGIPLRLMAANRTIADVLVQLRCERCHQRPTSVAVAENPAGRAHGVIGPPGWRVVLIGEDES